MKQTVIFHTERHGGRSLQEHEKYWSIDIHGTAIMNLLTIEEWHALRLSFQVATCAALVGLPFAVAIGYWLARSRAQGKWLVEVLVNLPLVLPPVVVGYLLLVCFSPRGPAGSLLLAWFGIKVVFTWWGAAMACVVVSFPSWSGRCALPFRRSTLGWRWRPRAWARDRGERSYRQSPSCAARADRRVCSRVRPQPRGVRGHDHGCRKYRRPDSDYPLGDLYLDEPTGRHGSRRGGWWAWQSSWRAGRWASANGSSGGGLPMPLLEFQCRHRFASGFQLDVAFELDRRFTTLLGPSGAGKTTVLSIIAGLVRPQEGRVRLGDRTLLDTAAGVCVPIQDRSVGVVFQDALLFPHLTVEGQPPLWAATAAPETQETPPSIPARD